MISVKRIGRLTGMCGQPCRGRPWACAYLFTCLVRFVSPLYSLIILGITSNSPTDDTSCVVTKTASFIVHGLLALAYLALNILSWFKRGYGCLCFLVTSIILLSCGIAIQLGASQVCIKFLSDSQQPTALLNTMQVLLALEIVLAFMTEVVVCVWYERLFGSVKGDCMFCNCCICLSGGPEEQDVENGKVQIDSGSSSLGGAVYDPSSDGLE